MRKARRARAPNQPRGRSPGVLVKLRLRTRMDPLAAVGIVLSALLVLFLALSYQVYRRAFVPARPMWLDDFSFTPFEFQADYEEVELVTADGINFGAWHFRQPGSPQTVIVSGGHRIRAQAHPQCTDRAAGLLDGGGRFPPRRRRRARSAGTGARQPVQRPAQAADRERP